MAVFGTVFNVIEPIRCTYDWPVKVWTYLRSVFQTKKNLASKTMINYENFNR